jgi:hypothetical protein
MALDLFDEDGPPKQINVYTVSILMLLTAKELICAHQ